MQIIMFLVDRLIPIMHAFFVLFIMLTLIVAPCYILFVPDWKRYSYSHRYEQLVKRRPYIRYIVLIVGLTEYLYILLALYLSLR